MAINGTPNNVPTTPMEDRPPANEFEDGVRWNVELNDSTIVHFIAKDGEWEKTSEEFGEVSIEVLSHDGIENVKQHGAVGDGVTDDSAAFQSAADSATPRGAVYVPFDCHSYIGSQVDIDGGISDSEISNENPNDLDPFRFICHGSIKPASGIKAIHIHNMNQPKVNINVEGGDGTPESDAALYMTECNAPEINAVGLNYGGTVVEAERGSAKMSQVKYGHLYSLRCGQTLWAKDHTGMGSIQYLWENRPQLCSKFHNTGDLSIKHYENYVPDATTDRGVVFDGGGDAIWIESMEVGGDLSETPHIKFIGLDKIDADNIYSLTSAADGIIFDSCRDVDVDITVRDASLNGVYIDETQTEVSDDIEIKLNASGCGKNGVSVSSNVTGDYIRVDGVSKNHFSSGVNVLSTSPDVLVNKMHLYGNGDEDLFISSDANVHILDSLVGSVTGSPTTNRQL